MLKRLKTLAHGERSSVANDHVKRGGALKEHNVRDVEPFYDRRECTLGAETNVVSV